MHSSMKLRLCIKWIRLQVRSSTKIMCSSFAVGHPLYVSQASERASDSERKDEGGGRDVRNK
jgi:hypothetical protein